LDSGAAIPETGAKGGDLTGRFSRGRSRRSWAWRLTDREWLDGFCERGVLGSVLAIITFGPLAMGCTELAQFLVLLGLGLLVIGFWGVRIWIRQQYRFLFPPFAWAVVAFAAYAMWRYRWVDIEYAARLELLQVILYAVLFFAILDNLTRQESTQILLFALIFLGMLEAFYAVYQFFADSSKVLWFIRPDIYKHRGSGTYICPNHLGGFLEMVLPVALAYTIIGRHKPLLKVFLGYAALSIMAGIAVSISRGAYLASGAALAVFFVVLLWNRNFRIPALAILVLLLVTSSFFGVRSWQTKKRFAELENPSMRLKYWEPAVKLWKDNPWFGIGPAHYEWRFRPYRFWNLQGNPVYVHNDYLNTGVEYGAAGIGIVALGLLALGWGVLKSWKFVRRSNEIATKPSNRSAVVLGCAVGLLAIAFHSVADFNMHVPGNAVVAVALMAILTSHIRFATERYWFNPGIVGRIAASILLLAAAGWFGWQEMRLGKQSYLLGKNQKRSFEETVALLKRVHQIEPQNDATLLSLGEMLRKKAWEGEDGWEQLIEQAIPCFEAGIKLNRWNPYNYMNIGLCNDWLKRRDQATPFFDKSLELDPKNYYLLAMYGWHRMQFDDLEGAKKYFTESYTYYWRDNPIAQNYLKIIERRLAEKGAKL
jgi:O-antigen ligase